jgi:hypothetical protein
MAISERSSTGLAHISQTIPNRHCWPASCKAGAQSTSSYYSHETLLTNFFRCTAPAADLDSKRHVRRSQAHTELLVEGFELSVLWDEYGLVGDVVVSILPSYFCFRILIIPVSHSLAIFPGRIFMTLCRLIYYIR